MCLETVKAMQIDSNYTMTWIIWPNGLRRGKCCLIVGSVSAYTQDMGMKTHTISADMKVSEQCGIAAAKGNQIHGLIRRNIVYKEKELLIPL